MFPLLSVVIIVTDETTPSSDAYGTFQPFVMAISCGTHRCHMLGIGDGAEETVRNAPALFGDQSYDLIRDNIPWDFKDTTNYPVHLYLEDSKNAVLRLYACTERTGPTLDREYHIDGIKHIKGPAPSHTLMWCHVLPFHSYLYIGTYTEIEQRPYVDRKLFWHCTS